MRNIGHTLAKLLEEHASALVMRGTEGEVVANTRRKARVDLLHAGICTTLWEIDSVASGDAPSLPAAHDVVPTAQWTRSVLAGEYPVPQAIATQVEAIFTCLREISPAPGIFAEPRLNLATTVIDAIT